MCVFKSSLFLGILVSLPRHAILPTINMSPRYSSWFILICQLLCARSVASVVSDSLWPPPARLFCPWDFSSKNPGVGCHFLLQEIFSIQGLNPCLVCLLHCGRFFTINHWGKPLKWFILKYGLNSLLASFFTLISVEVLARRVIWKVVHSQKHCFSDFTLHVILLGILLKFSF